MNISFVLNLPHSPLGWTVCRGTRALSTTLRGTRRYTCRDAREGQRTALALSTSTTRRLSGNRYTHSSGDCPQTAIFVLKGASTERRLVDIGRPWLRLLGWWGVPTAALRFQIHLERYVTWMRDERGFSSSTVVQWRSKIRNFLQWYERTDRPLHTLEPSDVDMYFVTEGTRRWSRVATSSIAAAVRVFLRYMATCGECDPRVAEAIRGPRLYAQESLPSGPAWSDVHRLLAHAGGDSPADVRDRAILMLLAIYGMRSGEVKLRRDVPRCLR